MYTVLCSVNLLAELVRGEEEDVPVICYGLSPRGDQPIKDSEICSKLATEISTLWFDMEAARCLIVSLRRDNEIAITKTLPGMHLVLDSISSTSRRARVLQLEFILFSR
jgi:hypothetical protein